jgi:hypothetical protein
MLSIRIEKGKKNKVTNKKEKIKYRYKVKQDLRLTQLTSFSPATVPEMLVDIRYPHEGI